MNTNNNINTTKEELLNGHCTQCDRHCPLNNVSCKRGEKYVEDLKTGNISLADHASSQEHNHKGHHPREHRRESFDGKHERGFHGKHKEHRQHGPHNFQNPHDFHTSHEYQKDIDWEHEELDHLFRAVSDRIFRRGGRQNGQIRVLQIIGRHGEIPQKHLQEILDIQPGSLSELLNKLEEKELIERVKDQNDKRKVVVKLTDTAAQKSDLHHERQEDHFSMLNDQEKEQLKGLLKKILE